MFEYTCRGDRPVAPTLLEHWKHHFWGLFSPTGFIMDRHRMSARHPMSGKTLVW